MVSKVQVTNSARETQKLGEKLANTLKKGGVVACYGELGSGKTTFIQGLLKGLGVNKRIISPTFVFIREYEIDTNNREYRHEAPLKIYHVDLYRINSLKDVYSLGMEEILSNSANIVAIEWAEKIKNILPKKRIDIFFKYVSENERKITTCYKNS